MDLTDPVFRSPRLLVENAARFEVGRVSPSNSIGLTAAWIIQIELQPLFFPALDLHDAAVMHRDFNRSELQSSQGRTDDFHDRVRRRMAGRVKGSGFHDSARVIGDEWERLFAGLFRDQILAMRISNSKE